MHFNIVIEHLKCQEKMCIAHDVENEGFSGLYTSTGEGGGFVYSMSAKLGEMVSYHTMKKKISNIFGY